MLLKPAWFLASVLGISLAESFVEDVQGEIAQAVGIQGQLPLFYEEPPHFPDDKCPCTTIYNLLSNDSRFSLVTKALSYADDVASLLNDSSSRITFFAPPDKVLRRPREKPCPHDDCSVGVSTSSPPFADLDQLSENDIPSMISGYGDFGEAIHAMEQLESPDHQDDPDDDRRKKIIRAVIRAVLRYHILPGVYDIESFGEKMTYATNLTVRGAMDDQALRLRISQSVIPPETKINFFTRITRPDIKALNGKCLVHVVDSPLIPPPSIFQQLYMVPRIFSTLTSALQRTGLNNFTDLRFLHDGKLTGASAVTVFAPTNDAFDALPRKLKLFLFSPFGERALRKLIEYHIVPNAIVHSNFVHGDVIEPIDELYEEEDEDCIDAWLKKHKHKKHKKHHKKPHHTELISKQNLTLVSLLPNHTLDAVILREKVTFPEEIAKKHKHKKPKKHHPEYHLINTKVLVNKQPAIVTDVVAFNGAVHVVDRLLDPRHCRCGEAYTADDETSNPSWEEAYAHDEGDSNDDVWNGWEEWLLDWVAT